MVVVLECLDQFKDVGAEVSGKFMHYFQFLEVLVVRLESSVNFSLADDLNRDLDIAVLVLGEDDEAEGTLAQWAHGLVLVDALLWVEALGLQNLTMPVRLCLRSFEINRSLLGG